MWQYGKREYGNLVFNQLTVELTTASSYLGQGAGLLLVNCNHPRAYNISWGVISKFCSLHFISMIFQE